MNLEKLILYGVIIILVYKVFFITEKLTNDDITAKISELYKADVSAIRNLSELANNLTKDGKLVLPGGLEIKGDITVEGNSDVKGQTTIHELYGGKSTWGGWRNIKVNGGHIMFDVGNHGYGFHSNGRFYHKKNNKYTPLTINNGLIVTGKIESPIVTGKIESPSIKTNYLTIDKGNEKYGSGMSVYGAKDEPFYINYYTNDDKTKRKGYMMFGHDNTSKVYFSGSVQGSNLKTGYKLLHYQLNDNATHDTGYSSNDWVLTVAGVNMDWSGGSPGAYLVYTFIQNNKWYLRSEIERTGDKSGILVLAIPRANFEEVTTHRVGSNAGY